MFLVSHSLEIREREIKSWVSKHPSVALIVAAVYFEWTISRAIVGLSKRPNMEVREKLQKVFGLERYKALWLDELSYLPGAKSLPKIVSNWLNVTIAFEARNRLVHGRDRYTQKMVRPKIEGLINAVAEVCAYSLAHGVNLNARLPQRRKRRIAAISAVATY